MFRQFRPNTPEALHCASARVGNGPACQLRYEGSTICSLPKTSRSTGRWPSGSERIYAMEKRYWNCRMSAGAFVGGLPFPAGEPRVAESGSIRCNDSREREYTSRCPIVVRPDTMFDRFVKGFAVLIESLLGTLALTSERIV